MTDYGAATEAKIDEIIEACVRYGESSIISLSGVPGTGKSYLASIAAQRFAGEPLLIREIQFHQSFSYEEFIEGMRIDDSGGVKVVPGVFLEWNQQALDDSENRYVLLIEELSRANLPAVLGELMTYLEHRERPFLSVYSRQPVRVALNLTVIATFNPTDRSALELDAALLRRMRIIRFIPSTEQLAEMLERKSTLSQKVVEQLQKLFESCRRERPDEFEYVMPFGHGIFAEVRDEQPDLYQLWEERIRHFLWRPLVEPHSLADLIEQEYPWRDPNFKLK